MLNVKNMLRLGTKESMKHSKVINESVQNNQNYCVSTLIKTFILGATLSSSASLFALTLNLDAKRLEVQESHSKPQENKFSPKQYMQLSLKNMFDNTNGFECDSDKRSAICTIPSYQLKAHNLVLKDFRYTIDYKDSRVIERLSGKLATNNFMSDIMQQFMPKQFECSDFTQLINKDNQVKEQVACTIKSDIYDIWFRLRADVFTSLLKDKKAFELLDKSIILLNSILYQVADAKNMKELDTKLQNVCEVLKQINVNLYGIEISITKPHNLPQKVYELLFEPDEPSQFNRRNQISQTLYNTGVGYIYGHAMGYVWGNDTIDARTKEGLNAILVALRDAAMLDSNIRTVSIKITNRTKQGFNLARATKKILHKIDKIQKPEKEYVGKTINSFDGTFLNRYRIEVEALRSKQRGI